MIERRRCCSGRAEAVGFKDRMAPQFSTAAHSGFRLRWWSRLFEFASDPELMHLVPRRSVVAYDHSASVESRIVLRGNYQDPVRGVNVRQRALAAVLAHLRVVA